MLWLIFHPLFSFYIFVIRRGEGPPPYEYSINGIEYCNHRHIAEP